MILNEYTLLVLLSTIATASAQTTTTTTVEPTTTAPPSYTSTADFESTILQVSNEYRRQHNASALIWNGLLAAYALDWAQKCQWEHSYGPYGENLATGYPNVTAAVCAWGDEGEEYIYHPPTGFTEATGHFTQLVWRATMEVGCAAVNCGYNTTASSDGADGWYVVCEYVPMGNVEGRDNAFFKKNVLPYARGLKSGAGRYACRGSLVVALVVALALALALVLGGLS